MPGSFEQEMPLTRQGFEFPEHEYESSEL